MLEGKQRDEYKREMNVTNREKFVDVYIVIEYSMFINVSPFKNVVNQRLDETKRLEESAI